MKTARSTIMDRKEFCSRLKAVRSSIAEFAELIGRTPQQVYTSGEQYPVPVYARTILRLIKQRGGADGLFN